MHEGGRGGGRYPRSPMVHSEGVRTEGELQSITHKGRVHGGEHRRAPMPTPVLWVRVRWEGQVRIHAFQTRDALRPAVVKVNGAILWHLHADADSLSRGLHPLMCPCAGAILRRGGGPGDRLVEALYEAREGTRDGRRPGLVAERGEMPFNTCGVVRT